MPTDSCTHRFWVRVNAMAIGQLLSRCLYFHVSHRDRKRSIRKGTTGGSRLSRSQNCSERGSMEVRARFPLLLRLHRWECGPVSCIMRRQSTSKPMPRWRLYSSAVNTALAFSLTRNISTRIDLCRPFGHGSGAFGLRSGMAGSTGRDANHLSSCDFFNIGSPRRAVFPILKQLHVARPQLNSSWSNCPYI
jgi:hypothetical protein